MSKLLVLNCIKAAAPRRAFDERVAPRLGELSRRAWELAHLLDERPLPGPDRHSHLVISGSELSAARVNQRDDALLDMIRAFVAADRAVLGICYGHQMIARALTEHFSCRRARVPEFGWRRLTLAEDALLSGIPELIAAHSHYDEVFDLPPPFRVIASTASCATSAFAYGARPVWGTQFHPEQTYELGTAMLQDNLRTEPRARELYVDELHDPALLRHNERLFENFFHTG